MKFLTWVALAVFSSGCLKKTNESETKGLLGKPNAVRPFEIAADPNDPFRPYGQDALMRKGSDKGKAIDIDWRRSVKLVPPSVARDYFSNYDSTTDYVIANVKEYNNFYVAKFKKNALEKVVLNKERLFEKLAIHHTGLRFILKKGESFELVAQNKNDDLEPKEYQSLSFGIFALGAPGKYFGPKNSVKGDLVSAYMFFTPPEQSARARNVPIRFSMDELHLDLLKNSSTIFTLFDHLAREGDKLGYSEIYGMFINNCVHRLLTLIRDALPRYKSDGIIDKVLMAVYDTDVLPTGLANGFKSVIRNELERAGAVSKKAEWSSFWEVPDLISFVDELDCSEIKDAKDLRFKCAEVYSKEPQIIPQSIMQQQNYLVDRCISKNTFKCLKGAKP